MAADNRPSLAGAARHKRPPPTCDSALTGRNDDQYRSKTRHSLLTTPTSHHLVSNNGATSPYCKIRARNGRLCRAGRRDVMALAAVAVVLAGAAIDQVVPTATADHVVDPWQPS